MFNLLSVSTAVIFLSSCSPAGLSPAYTVLKFLFPVCRLLHFQGTLYHEHTLLICDSRIFELWAQKAQVWVNTWRCPASPSVVTESKMKYHRSLKITLDNLFMQPSSSLGSDPECRFWHLHLKVSMWKIFLKNSLYLMSVWVWIPLLKQRSCWNIVWLIAFYLALRCLTKRVYICC